MEAVHLLDNWRKVMTVCVQRRQREEVQGFHFARNLRVKNSGFLSSSGFLLHKKLFSFHTEFPRHLFLFSGCVFLICCWRRPRGRLRRASLHGSVRRANMMILHECFLLPRAENITTVFSISAAQHFRHANDSGCTPL